MKTINEKTIGEIIQELMALSASGDDRATKELGVLVAFKIGYADYLKEKENK